MKQMFHSQLRSFFFRVFAVLVVGTAVFHASPTRADRSARANRASCDSKSLAGWGCRCAASKQFSERCLLTYRESR